MDMGSEPTVEINLSIHIDVSGTYDTGYTVAEWNAMSDGRRGDIVAAIWSDEAAGHDNGGISVATDGAEEI